MNPQNLTDLLKNNPYPGRGILLGRSTEHRAVIAYFIMGRSENSRNRIFRETEDGIRTEAFDASKMTDPSLIIYHPVRRLDNGITIVANGDQTDTLKEQIEQGVDYRHALYTRTFEPDAPHWTPRISGVLKPDGSYCLSILKTLDGNPNCCCRYFFEYDSPCPGTGHFLSTYQGDGNPLPSFQGEPRLIALEDKSAHTLSDELWNALNADNKVSLFVQTIDLIRGTIVSIITNRNISLS